MDTAKDDLRTSITRLASDLVSAHGIAGMNADAHDVARRNLRDVELCERFIDQM